MVRHIKAGFFARVRLLRFLTRNGFDFSERRKLFESSFTVRGPEEKLPLLVGHLRKWGTD